MEAAYTLPQLGWKQSFQQQLSLEELSDFTVARVAIAERSELILFSEAERITWGCRLIYLQRNLKIALNT